MLHRHGGDIFSCLGDRDPSRASGREEIEYAEKKIRDFSANINFLGMPERVREAAVQAVELSVHYPDPEYRALRAAIAHRENRRLRESGQPGEERQSSLDSRNLWEPGQSGEERQSGPESRNLWEPGRPGKESQSRPDSRMPEEHGREKDPGITPDHVICGNGAAELMFALAAARGPKHALLAVPSFFEYEQALRGFGCEVRYFPLRAEQDFLLDDSFLDAADEETDCIVLGNPNNPTGRLVGKDLLERLVKKCGERGILLVLDESFFEFLDAEGREKTFSGVRAVLAETCVFVLRSFTKMYGMPGLRFGYGICGDFALLERMRAVLQPWNVSLPAQAAAEQAARELDFADGTARRNAGNRERLKRQMEENGYRVFPSDANFLLFQGPRCLREFCLERGFLIRDCSNFPGLEKGYFRVCVRSREENDALVRVLAQAAVCREERGDGEWRKES